jgi:hypothetical protein
MKLIVTKLRKCRGSLAVAQTRGLLTPPLESFGYSGTRHIVVFYKLYL